MPLELSLQCPYCNETISWIYDTDEEHVHRDLKGCPGKQCALTYNLHVNPVTEERAAEVLDDHVL